MKQALVKKGLVYPVDVPQPITRNGCIKIKVLYSCVSKGTELKGIHETGKSIVKMALGNPAKIKATMEMIRTKGLKLTTKKVSKKVGAYSSLGYSISGIVVEVGENVSGFKPGDLVSGGGQGFALHAEYVVIPKNLVVKVPRGIPMELASMGTIGSIALHGVRRLDLKLGEFGVVYGTGLLGLLALQMMRASGIRVACVDINETSLKIAHELGAEIIINSQNEDPVLATQTWTDNRGVDAVLYAAATSDATPLANAFRMCRKKGRVVVMGVVGMNVDRSDVYKNEIDLLISTSYGPGRYDDEYELKGHDYPYAYVRWTENRNIYEFLRLVRDGVIKTDLLKPAVYPIDEVTRAYNSLNEANSGMLAIISYGKVSEDAMEQTDGSLATLKETLKIKHQEKKIYNIGLIGAGSFATGYLLPIIERMKGQFALRTVSNRTGDKALRVAQDYGANIATSDYKEILSDSEIDLVMICTRHNSHAGLVLAALKAGKHVYVEKPLATSESELREIEDFYNSQGTNCPLLMVGFNRRFSPYALEVKNHLLHRQSPVFIRYRMNAGFVPYDSWIHEDGGRIIGEACHIIDLFHYLTDSPVTEIHVNSLAPSDGRFRTTDNMSIALKYGDGSIASLDYFSMGSKALAKEYMEIHFDSKTLVIDDYCHLESFGIKAPKINSKIPDKGHAAEWEAAYQALRTGVNPIPIQSLIDTTRISILAANSAKFPPTYC